MLCARPSSTAQLAAAALLLALAATSIPNAAAISSLTDLTPWQQGQSMQPHPKGCPTGWLWVSAQQWWQLEQQEPPLVFNASVAQDSGHIHNELCWPQGLPMAGPSTLIKIQKLLHANSGYDWDLGVVLHPTTLPAPITPTPRCPTSYYLCNGTYVTNGLLRYATNCAATGGVAGAQGVAGLLDCQWTDTLDINADAMRGSDIVQAQIKARSRNPADSNREQRAMADLSAFVYNGNVSALLAFNPDTNRLNNRIAAEGWTDGVQYGRVTLFYPPKLPIGGVWRFNYEIDRVNTASLPITSHIITLDPSFHANNPGSILRQEPGRFVGQITVNVTALKTGWHRIFALAKQLDPRTNATQTSVLGTFFEVAGGPQAGSATNMAPGVPVMTQSTEFGPILGSGAGYMQSEYVFYRNWTVNHNFAQFDIGWFAAAGMAVQAASVQIMHGGIWPKEQMGQMLNLGAREVLNETWTALAARNGRPPAFDTTRLVGSGTVTGDGLFRYRTINLDPAFVNRKLRCDPSGRLSIAFFIDENLAAPPPVLPAGVTSSWGYGYRVGWMFPNSTTGAFLMLTPSALPLADAVPAC